MTAANGLNSTAAANGFKYQTMQNVETRLTSAANVYQGFVSNIEDVDMPEAVTRLNQSQLMVQAALQVTAHLNQTSLLDFFR